MTRFEMMIKDEFPTDDYMNRLEDGGDPLALPSKGTNVDQVNCTVGVLPMLPMLVNTMSDCHNDQVHFSHLEREKNLSQNQCTVGNKFDNYNNGVNQRKLRLHTNKNNYECDKCHCCFNRKSNLIVHLKSHTGEKNYKCDVCVWKVFCN